MTENPWDKKALEFGDSEYGAHTDHTLVDLENDFIEGALDQIQPDRILDVGCGNGRRTRRWANYASMTWGIDSSEEMIKLAKQLEQEGLHFAQMDVRELEKRNTYDMIISARCLINLPTKADQIALIDAIWAALAPGGYFICCEGRAEGTEQLDKMRAMFDVAPLTLMKENLNLDEDVIDHVWRKFNNNAHQSTLGIYYFITRVLTQIKMQDPKEVAKRLQLEYDDMLELCTLGRHFCFCGRK